MSATEVAKTPTQPPPRGEDDDKVSTWKGRKRVLKILRLISAHLDLNQEDTLDLFEREFDNYLARLQAKDLEDRRRNRPE
jgi:hypothetical protein